MTETENKRAQIAQIVELARAGHHQDAMAQATALVGDGVDDPVVAHLAGHVFQIAGVYQQALLHFEAALHMQPDLHFTHMEVGAIHQACGRPADALVWFDKARHCAPAYLPAHRRVAEMERHLGQHGQALETLRRANAADQGNAEVAADFVESLVYHNRRDDARRVYEAVGAAGRLRQQDVRHYLALMTEIGQYQGVIRAEAATRGKLDAASVFHAQVLTGHAKLVLAIDRNKTIADAAARERGPRWYGTAEVMARLRDAIAQQRPLSLVRLGDGEARFLAYFDPRLRDSLTVDEANILGDVPFQAWFGKSVLAFDPAEVARLYAASIVAFEQADILGVTSAERLERDNIHIGYLGYAEKLIASFLKAAPSMALADAFVHIGLHQLSPHLKALLSGLDTFSMISPHAGLAARLATACAVPHSSEYLVPGEALFLANRPGESSQPHFPARYEELRASLQVRRRGEVFLVAAGLLGKIYCQTIKQRGGIAIDIGSIVDAWLGLRTRPGSFDPIEQWIL